MAHARTHSSSRPKAAHHLDVHSIGDAFSGVQGAVVHGVEGLGDAVKSTIKEKPLQSLGVALGVGVLLSLLIRK